MANFSCIMENSIINEIDCLHLYNQTINYNSNWFNHSNNFNCNLIDDEINDFYLYWNHFETYNRDFEIFS